MASPAMRAFDRLLRLVAVKDVTVTLVGETGTGKEVMAHRLHELSRRRGGPFVPINCAAIPEALFESELFGHERGAFTGATERARGKVEAAGGGTLFLDEIAEMPLGLQSKLLRFIELRRFMRVGGTTKLEADVRLVTASQEPLEHQVRAGRFRADLAYRLQGIALTVPPLREHRSDIPALVERFVTHFAALHGCEPPVFSRRAREALQAYGWPGNVRELRNVVERLCILHEGQTVQAADLPEVVRAAGDETPTTPGGAQISFALDQPLSAVTDQFIDAVVASEGGNITRAAERLQVSARTLQRRRRKH